MAGKIAHLTLNQVEKVIKPGLNVGDLFDVIESLITKKADLAFPPNISVNETAAHDSAAINEKRTLSKKALVKIDVGANVNGMLSDTARTFSLDGKNSRLIKASKDALKAAIDVIKPGIRLNVIGEVVQDTIESFGYKPIAN